ncbi:hypothetical protein ACU4GD_16655 [Cupriavidus basilensis]
MIAARQAHPAAAARRSLRRGPCATGRQAREALLPRVAFMPAGTGAQPVPDALRLRERRGLLCTRLLGSGCRRAVRHSASTAPARGHRPGAPFLDRPAGKLSGGMKQKLGLCCALVLRSRPDLISRRAHHGRGSHALAALSSGPWWKPCAPSTAT